MFEYLRGWWNESGRKNVFWILMLVVVFILGYGIGDISGIHTVYDQAIDNGFGYWEGKTMRDMHFVWGKTKVKVSLSEASFERDRGDYWIVEVTLDRKVCNGTGLMEFNERGRWLTVLFDEHHPLIGPRPVKTDKLRLFLSDGQKRDLMLPAEAFLVYRSRVPERK